MRGRLLPPCGVIDGPSRPTSAHAPRARVLPALLARRRRTTAALQVRGGAGGAGGPFERELARASWPSLPLALHARTQTPGSSTRAPASTTTSTLAWPLDGEAEGLWGGGAERRACTSPRTAVPPDRAAGHRAELLLAVPCVAFAGTSARLRTPTGTLTAGPAAPAMRCAAHARLCLLQATAHAAASLLLPLVLALLQQQRLAPACSLAPAGGVRRQQHHRRVRQHPRPQQRLL